MGTAATATLIAGTSPSGSGLYKAIFTVLLDTTTADGLQTVDLTSHFSKVYAIQPAGELVATKTGYMIKGYKPAYATALTATNLSLGFYESGGDGDELDPVASTDLAAVITGLTIVVEGKAVGNSTST